MYICTSHHMYILVVTSHQFWVCYILNSWSVFQVLDIVIGEQLLNWESNVFLINTKMKCKLIFVHVNHHKSAYDSCTHRCYAIAISIANITYSKAKSKANVLEFFLFFLFKVENSIGNSNCRKVLMFDKFIIKHLISVRVLISCEMWS